mmetsp:Transcript_44772/g.97463  ORF Transcript_44772/g.97463 Transcript_44772/m.97463 type:complete len:678 (-) Transcript_44772:354-2387(-)
MLGDGEASTLEAERQRASFPVRELTYLLHRGREVTERNEKLQKIVEADPVFDNSDINYLSRPERYQRAMQKQRRVLELARELSVPPQVIRGFVHDELGTDLQNLMFVPNIRSTFSTEQQALWLPKALTWEVIGCYAQTELGHGSNVRALETTATYVAESDEIEIHSPTTTSTKWWPGALGRTANHAIVYARLLVGGRDLGIHNFMVPIRDMATHEPLPGISVGDIGPKIGYNNQDNGFCRFDHVRIPRTNMAMKYATLHKGGEYESAAARKTASYSSMTYVRGQIVIGSGTTLSMACTIAVRYSAVRRQGFSSSAEGRETLVLDYTMQQQRLLPLLATSYAFHFTGNAMQDLLKSDDAAALHLASSGLKALCTRITSDGIEACRKACGGHGYLSASGLPELFGTYVQNSTVEGENFMIAQQTAKGLLKLYASAVADTKARTQKRKDSSEPIVSAQPVAMTESAGDSSYILDAAAAAAARCSAGAVEDFLSPALQLEAYRQRSAWLVMDTQRKLIEAELNGLSAVDAWNLTCPDAIRVSEAHCFYVLLSNFVNAVEDLSKRNPDLIPPLRSCCNLFALWWMQDGMGDFLESGYLNATQASFLRDAVRQQLGVVRLDAVPLVDAWNHSDHALRSALGKYDGRVYEALLASAQPDVNPMNRDIVDRAFEESLKPMRQSKL